MTAQKKIETYYICVPIQRLLVSSALLILSMAAGAAQAAPVIATATLPVKAQLSAAAAPAPSLEAYAPALQTAAAPSVAPTSPPSALLEYTPPQAAPAAAAGKDAPDAVPWPGFRREVETGSSGPDLSSEQLYYMQITRHPLPVIPMKQRLAFERDIVQASRETHVQPALIRAVISAESGYNPSRISPKGAIGLMQVLPETAQRFGVRNVFNPAENIKAGSRYLAFLLRVFNNDVHLALAAYNAGEQAVIRYGNQVPPYRETINYVPRVLGFYQHYLRHPMKSEFQARR